MAVLAAISAFSVKTMPVIGRKLLFVAHHLTKRELPRKPGVKSAAGQGFGSSFCGIPIALRVEQAES
jgi:hypothetical protein